jgi:hypothetical protein
MLIVAHDNLREADRDSDDEQFSGLLSDVFCPSMASRREPELVALYYTVGRWLLTVTKKNFLCVDAIYRYLRALVSCESEDRGTIVGGILVRLELERPSFPYHDLDCFAELIALGLMPEGYMEHIAKRAVELASQAPTRRHFGFCVRALAELEKRGVPEVRENIVNNADFFAERISQVKKPTQAIIGRMLLQFARNGEVDAGILRAGLSVFPVRENSAEVAQFAQEVIAAGADERLGGDVMMALARYFAARPRVRTEMNLGEEIVGSMKFTLMRLMEVGGITRDELARRMGEEEMILPRLELALLQ